MKKFLIVLLFSDNVYASTNSSISDSFGSLLIFPFLFILMYFLLIRPQSKKVKEHKNLLDNLKIGDEIVTQGGIIGKIKKIFDQFIILSLNDNFEILLKKESVITILPKGTIKQFK